jgi:hypothetical protein
MTIFQGTAVLIARIGVLACYATAFVSGQPTLTITLPKDGAVVRPGEALKVNVKASNEPAKAVFILGGAPIGVSTMMLDAPPYNFTIEIPKKINPGLHILTASGSSLSGAEAKPDTIAVDVERSDSPVSLRVDPMSLHLHVNEEAYVTVIGTFGDGETVFLENSTLNKFLSSAPRVVSAQGDGRVNGLMPGSAVVTIINGKAKVSLSVTVSPE